MSLALFVTEPQLAIPNRVTLLSKSLDKELFLKASPTNFMQPLFVPPVVTRAFVVVATLTKPFENLSFNSGLILFNLAPPVTDMIKFGSVMFQNNLSNKSVRILSTLVW